MRDIYNEKDLFRHFLRITLLNVYVLDIFYYRMYSYADSYSYSRMVLWGIFAVIEQIVLWKSNIVINNFWWFCLKILNPVVWFAVCWIWGA